MRQVEIPVLALEGHQLDVFIQNSIDLGGTLFQITCTDRNLDISIIYQISDS